MARSVKIDFERVIVFEEISSDLRTALFPTTLQDGKHISIKLQISDRQHERLPGVYNFAFGPVDATGEINDMIMLPHKDHAALFSTLLFAAYSYLEKHREHLLGIDGSTNSRAYLYWRYLQYNYDYISKHFEVFGVKHYVRICRFGKEQYENPFDFSDVLSFTHPIKKTSKLPEQMYNYFVLKPKLSDIKNFNLNPYVLLITFFNFML